MTVYLDIVFIENTLMNYIILLTTGIICREKVKQIRIITSSIIGSIYAVSLYITRLEIYLSILSKIVLSIGMIYIAFKPLKLKKFIKNEIIFYLTSFAFGGCAFAFLYYLDAKQITLFKGKFIGIYPIKATVIGGILGFIIVNIAFRVVKDKINMSDMFCNIKLYNKGEERKLKAMIDTGNFLKDPITNIPVLIIEKNSLIDILPKEILDNTEEIIKDREYLSRLRILPFSSLGKKNGMLLGVKVDKVEVETNDECVTRENIIIAVYNSKLSNSSKYNCLIGLNYLET